MTYNPNNFLNNPNPVGTPNVIVVTPGPMGQQGVQGIQGIAGNFSAQGTQGTQGLQGGGFNQAQGTQG
jgi:hypothetical protein